MLKPVMPYITDLIAHLLFFKDHVQTVHAHHGEYHAHAAVSEGAKNDQQEKNTNNNLKKDNTINDHIVNETSQSRINALPFKYSQHISIQPMNISIAYDHPPPRLVEYVPYA